MDYLNYLGIFFGGLATVGMILYWLNTRKRVTSLEGDLLAREEESKKTRQMLTKVIQEREQFKKETEKKQPLPVTHTILLDGVSGAGKTTCVARVLKPVMDKEGIEDLIATHQERLTERIPICEEYDGQATRMHYMRFFDVPGEQPESVINALYDLDSRAEQVILLVIWDITKNHSGKAEFNKPRLKGVYRNKMAQKYVKSVVVFFNKTDMIETKTEIERKYNEAKQILEPLFLHIFQDDVGEIKYFRGSFLEGTGWFELYAQILREFDLERLYNEDI